MKPPADSAAGRPGRERERGEQEHRPRGDDPPAAADGEAAEASKLEAGPVNVRLAASSMLHGSRSRLPVAEVPFC